MKNKATVYCRVPMKGIHEFRLSTGDGDYYLFRQSFRQSIKQYFRLGVPLDKALDFSLAGRDTAVTKAMEKLPMYIRYIEKEYGISVLEQTSRKNRKKKSGGYDRRAA